MYKIARIDAFYEITKAIKTGDIDKANAMFKVVTDSIASDKDNNTFSEYIKLKGKKQELLFKNILLNDEN